MVPTRENSLRRWRYRGLGLAAGLILLLGGLLGGTRAAPLLPWWPNPFPEATRGVRDAPPHGAALSPLSPEILRCPLGRWLAGPARRQAEGAAPELAPWFECLEREHTALHRASQTISAFLMQGNRPAALAHHEQAAAPAFAEMFRLLEELQTVGRQVCRSRPDFGLCWRKFAVLYANLGATLCGCVSVKSEPRAWPAGKVGVRFTDKCRIAYPQPEPPSTSSGR